MYVTDIALGALRMQICDGRFVACEAAAAVHMVGARGRRAVCGLCLVSKIICCVWIVYD